MLGREGLIVWLEERNRQHYQDIEQNRKIREALTRYPDLKQNTSRWRDIRYCTPALNGSVTDCEIKHACGCCPDSLIYVWPYVENDGFRLYAHPIPFTVGNKYIDDGEEPREGWDIKMREAGIPELVIQKVVRFFEDNPPRNFDEDTEHS